MSFRDFHNKKKNPKNIVVTLEEINLGNHQRGDGSGQTHRHTVGVTRRFLKMKDKL